MFRNRKLTSNANVYEHNIWDDVGIEGEQLASALEKISIDNKNANTQKYEQSQESWERFYRKHNDSFFKDRKWIEHEFSDIQKCKRVLEIGCGVGNSLAWLYNNTKESKKEKQTVFGCDFSAKAVKIAQKRFPDFHFFVHDISSDCSIYDDANACKVNWTSNIEVGEEYKFDCIICIFVMSAIDPAQHDKIVQKMHSMLRKGGKVYFKDYAYLDMIQLRYKSEQIVKENFYKRKDGTYTHFFCMTDAQNMFAKQGFDVEQLFEDKRMKVNRKTKTEMYRKMLQGIFVKK